MSIPMTTATSVHRLQPAADASRVDRNVSHDALRTLEDALAAPAPGREGNWLARVHAALADLADALAAQAGRDSESASILSEIAAEEPRFRSRIEHLRREHDDLSASVTSLLTQISPDPDREPDTADIRDRLASVARRFRQHRAREADLIYEAVNINLGIGD